MSVGSFKPIPSEAKPSALPLIPPTLFISVPPNFSLLLSLSPRLLCLCVCMTVSYLPSLTYRLSLSFCRCLWLSSAFQKLCCSYISATRWATCGPRWPLWSLLWSLRLWCPQAALETFGWIWYAWMFLCFIFFCLHVCSSSLRGLLAYSYGSVIYQSSFRGTPCVEAAGRGENPSMGCPAFDVFDTASLWRAHSTDPSGGWRS